jgi:hypothetical protein
MSFRRHVFECTLHPLESQAIRTCILRVTVNVDGIVHGSKMLRRANSGVHITTVFMSQYMQGFFFGTGFDDSPRDKISGSYHVRCQNKQYPKD